MAQQVSCHLLESKQNFKVSYTTIHAPAITGAFGTLHCHQRAPFKEERGCNRKTRQPPQELRAAREVTANVTVKVSERFHISTRQPIPSSVTNTPNITHRTVSLQITTSKELKCITNTYTATSQCTKSNRVTNNAQYEANQKESNSHKSGRCCMKSHLSKEKQ